MGLDKNSIGYLLFGGGFCFRGVVKCSSCTGDVDASLSNSRQMITNDQNLDAGSKQQSTLQELLEPYGGWNHSLCRDFLSPKSMDCIMLIFHCSVCVKQSIKQKQALAAM